MHQWSIRHDYCNNFMYKVLNIGPSGHLSLLCKLGEGDQHLSVFHSSLLEGNMAGRGRLLDADIERLLQLDSDDDSDLEDLGKSEYCSVNYGFYNICTKLWKF